MKKSALIVLIGATGTEALLHRGSSTSPDDKYLPVGQGAYVSGEAVAQRTRDTRKGCEDSKIYKSANWADCFQKSGDYIDAAHDGAAPKASLLAGSPEKYLPVGQGAYVSGEAVAQRTRDTRKGCEDSKIYKSANWADCFQKSGDYIDATHDGAAPKALLLAGSPDKYLPVGQGAYVSGEAVAQRTRDTRKGCEDSKIYKSGNWADCFQKSGDYIDATHNGAAPKASLLHVGSNKGAGPRDEPVGDGAHVSGEAVKERTKDNRRHCENATIYESEHWQDCYESDYIDNSTSTGNSSNSSR